MEINTRVQLLSTNQSRLNFCQLARVCSTTLPASTLEWDKTLQSKNKEITVLIRVSLVIKKMWRFLKLETLKKMTGDGSMFILNIYISQFGVQNGRGNSTMTELNMSDCKSALRFQAVPTKPSLKPEQFTLQKQPTCHICGIANLSLEEIAKLSLLSITCQISQFVLVPTMHKSKVLQYNEKYFGI